MLSPALTRFVANIYLVALMRDAEQNFLNAEDTVEKSKFATSMPTSKLQSGKSETDFARLSHVCFQHTFEQRGFHLAPVFLLDNPFIEWAADVSRAGHRCRNVV